MNPPAHPARPSHSAAATTPLDALQAVIGSLDALRNGSALYVLMATFAVTGLLLGMTQSLLAKDSNTLGAVSGVLAVAAAFYGASAAGLLLMDQACGRPLRDVADAVFDALGTAHRLLAVLVLAACVPLFAMAAAAALVWLARLDVSGPLGPWLFALTLPVAVVSIGVAVLALTAVVVPLAGPAVWSGLGVRQTLRWLMTQARRRLLLAAVLMAAVAGLTSVIAVLVTAVVVAGGRVMAVLGILVGGFDLTPAQLMAALAGMGLRGAVSPTPYGSAALIGGGIVFALALVTPALVTLRGACAAFLILQRTDERAAGGTDE